MMKENLAELRELRKELRTYYPVGKKSADETLIQRRLSLRILELLDALDEAPLITIGRVDLYALLEENRLLREQVQNTLESNTRLVSQRRQIKESLRKLEWEDDQEGIGRPSFCPLCGAYKEDGHKPNCEFVKAMEMV